MKISLFFFLSFLCLAGNVHAQIGTSSVEASDSIIYKPLNLVRFGDIVTSDNRLNDVQRSVTSRTISSDAATHAAVSARVISGNEEDYTVNYSVGQIPYQESVSPSGGRILQVPIMDSPLSKFTPKISLVYNSQSGNGIAGYGWDVSGISSITIINKNLYYHSQVAPAHVNDINASFSLDGIPLVSNDGDLVAAGYSLETARGHILVKKHRSNSNNIAYFTALYPDGSKAIFGTETNTSPKTQYPISLWEDKLGNQIKYTYAYSTNSDYRVTSIEYKHKNNDNCVGRITFIYSGRNDWHIRYRAGENSCQNFILSEISTFSNEEKLRTYHLNYETGHGVSLLTSISCSNSSGEQLRPLSFVYGDKPYNDNSMPKDFVVSHQTFLPEFFESSTEVNFLYRRGKYQPNSYRDGVMILPHFSNYDIIASKWLFKTHYQYGSTYSPEQVILVASNLGDNGDAVHSITAESGLQCISPADIDGDGVDEIVKVNFGETFSSNETTRLKVPMFVIY